MDDELRLVVEGGEEQREVHALNCLLHLGICKCVFRRNQGAIHLGVEACSDCGLFTLCMEHFLACVLVLTMDELTKTIFVCLSSHRSSFQRG